MNSKIYNYLNMSKESKNFTVIGTSIKFGFPGLIVKAKAVIFPISLCYTSA